MEQNRYIEDWVRVFYATVWIAPERRAVHFMFGGQDFGLSRATIAGILGVDLVVSPCTRESTGTQIHLAGR